MVQWSVSLPTHLDTFERIEFTPRQSRALRHDEEQCGTWRDADGSEWVTYYLRWLPDAMVGRLDARRHSPDHCLPSAGRTLKEDAGLRAFPVHGIRLEVRRYVFDDGGRPLHVFYCLSEDGAEGRPRVTPLGNAERLLETLSARRRVGQRSFEIIVSGYSSLEEAEKSFESKLPQLIRVDGELQTAGGSLDPTVRQ
jgi:hypothetical protein